MAMTDDRTKVTKCTCGAEIIFRQHYLSGRTSPITAYSVRGGNVIVLPDGTYRLKRRNEIAPLELPINHFVDCPEQQKYRKPRKY